MANKVFTVISKKLTEENTINFMYLDIDMISSTPKHTKDKLYNADNFEILKLLDVHAVKNALHAIFTWIPGQRILLPEFGSNLRKLLYSGITPDNEQKIVAEIKYTILKWEPRIKIIKVYDAGTLLDHDNNTIVLIIVYSINGLSDEQFEYTYRLTISDF